MDLLNLFQKPQERILTIKYKKTIDDQIINRLMSFLKAGKSNIVTEVDGTISSLTAAVLLKEALGEKAITVIFDFDTPEFNTLINLCRRYNLNAYILKRGSAYQKELTAYGLSKPEDINSFYIRFKNYHLLTFADHNKARLLDNIDKSERLTNNRPPGFYGSFMLFYSLYKTEVFDLAKLLNINLPISDAWKKLDPLLYLLTEKQNSPEEINQQFGIDLNYLKKLQSGLNKQILSSTISQFII